MAKKPRYVYETIYQLLVDKGPQPLSKIRSVLVGYHERSMVMALRQLRGELPGEERKVRVRRWIPQRGGGGRPTPVYAIGTAPDADMPATADTIKRYAAKPEVKTRRQYTARERRLRQTAGSRAFKLMVNPIKPKEFKIPVTNVVQHTLEDWDEDHLIPIAKPTEQHAP